MATRSKVALHERAAELEAIDGLLEAARAGEGGALVIEGPPGIGKTRLMIVTRASTGPGMRVLWARASELERDSAFSVVRQLLEPVLREAGSEGRPDLLRDAAALAEPVLAAPFSGAEGSGGDTFAALHGLYWLIADLADGDPVLIIVDDLHWADASSLRFLLYLVQRLEGLAVALLLATRPAEGGGESDHQRMLDLIAIDPLVEVIRPDPLSEDAVGHLVKEALGAPPDASFVAACERVTGGNPFLLSELLGELARAEVVPSASNATMVQGLSSRGVSRSAQTRLQRLPPACRALARAVVILGDGTDVALAARLAGLDVRVASDAADRLAAAFILEDERPLSFVHPLVRASVYAELSSGERSAWHTRAGTELRAAGAASAQVASHLLASEPRGDPDTVSALREAATDALIRAAPEVAVTYLRRALKEPPGGELRSEVAFALGAAEVEAGDFASAVAHLSEAVGGLADPASRARAAARLGGALLFTGQVEAAVEALTEALDSLPPDERELGLLLQVVRTGAAWGSPSAWRAAGGASNRFRPGRDETTTAAERLCFAALAMHTALDGEADRARELALESLGEGALLDDPGPNEPMFYWAPLALLLADALEEATTVFDAVLEWARRRGSVFAFSQAVHCRALVWWSRGALAEAEADAEFALPYATYGVRTGVIALLEVRLARGDVEGAARLWREAGMDDASPTGRTASAQFQARAHLRAALGKRQEALQDLRVCEALEEQWDIRTPAVTNWRSNAALLLAAEGDRDEARRLAVEDVERCRRFGARRPLGIALRAAGQVADHRDALPLLEEAVTVLEPSTARLEHAHALVEHGVALRRAGSRGAARGPLGDAIRLAHRCGAIPLANRAHDELVAAGARPRRDPVQSRSKLTASEQRVARHAAGGMTNREIAQALFLTEKTIEVHLTNSYRKLGIASRSQLARALPTD